MVANGEPPGRSAMGWDAKGTGGRRYYYRTERQPGRPHPVKLYLGRGAAAHAEAGRVEAARAARAADRRACAELAAGLAEADRLADELHDWAEALADAWWILTGHHDHKGEWRMSRGRPD